MNKEKMFIARDENGKEIAFELLYTKNVDGKPIMWYTDGTTDDEGNKNVYVSQYKRDDNTFQIEAIEDAESIKKYADIFLNEYNEK